MTKSDNAPKSINPTAQVPSAHIASNPKAVLSSQPADNPSGKFSDTTSQFLKWMEDIRGLIRALKHDSFLQKWDRINHMVDTPLFSVAVVGEYSRGKSALINRVLGEKILPEGQLPTTTLLTHIVPGREHRLSLLQSNKTRQPLTPDGATLARVMEEGSRNDSAGSLELTLPNEWLESSGIAFYDTPSVGSLTGTRASLVWDALESSEAALVVVSALSPLSLTERTFVEEHVSGKQLPRVAVVISNLDQVNVEERKRVIDYIFDKVRSWKLDVDVWCAHGAPTVPEGTSLTTSGAGEIAKSLEKWSKGPARQQGRREQIVSQMVALLLTLRIELVSRLQLIQVDEKAKEAALERARTVLDTERTKWEDLRLEVDRRCNEAEAWLEKEMAERVPMVIERLSLDALKTPNPKEWWNVELPIRLSHELRNLSRLLSGTLSERLSQDCQWVMANARKSFSVQLTTRPGTPPVELGVDGAMMKLDGLLDVYQMRQLTRIIGLVAGAGGYFFFGFLGPVISGAATLGADQIFDTKIREQRDKFARLLENAISHAANKVSLNARHNLRAAYGLLLKETKDHELEWHQARLAALRGGVRGDVKSGDSLDQQISAVDDLLKQSTAFQA